MCVWLTTDRPINTAWDWGRGLGRHMASLFPVLVSSFKGYQEARGKDMHPGLILICCGYEQRMHAAVGVRTAGNTKGIPLPVPQFRDSWKSVRVLQYLKAWDPKEGVLCGWQAEVKGILLKQRVAWGAEVTLKTWICCLYWHHQELASLRPCRQGTYCSMSELWLILLS